MAPRSPPAKPVCPLCVLDQDHLAASHLGDGVWLFTCTNPAMHGDEAYSWQVAADGSQDDVELGGLTEEWGVYEDLFSCFELADPHVEYGIVEYRYQRLNPVRYGLLVERYGHTALGPHQYTASAFLAAALGRMCRHGDLVHSEGVATGYWSYNQTISYWALSGGDAAGPPVTWAAFAEANEIDPATWIVQAG